MTDVEVRLRLTGINQVMRAAQPVVDQVGQEMSADAGEGFEYVARPHRRTARGYVQVNSYEGARRQAYDAVLERVVGSRAR